MNQPNAINYIEFPALGTLAEMKIFYGGVFGWQFQDWGDTYVSFAAKEAGIEGGFDAETAATSGGMLVILYTDKLEETKARVEKAGGKIAKDIFAFPGGRRFHFIDPAGNELAIWSEK